jgi:hypothetical protein
VAVVAAADVAVQASPKDRATPPKSQPINKVADVVKVAAVAVTKRFI